MHNKEFVLKGLSACAEFLCSDCPYKEYDHHEFKLRCIHTLIEDLNLLYKEGEL